jgi:hypothetical protein
MVASLGKHKKLQYLLTFIDTFTGWIEAIPMATEGNTIVADTLFHHIIPHFGLLRSLQLDNSPAIISKFTQLVCKHLAITPHTTPNPQNSLSQLTWVTFNQMMLQVHDYQLLPMGSGCTDQVAKDIPSP